MPIHKTRRARRAYLPLLRAAAPLLLRASQALRCTLRRYSRRKPKGRRETPPARAGRKGARAIFSYNSVRWNAADGHSRSTSVAGEDGNSVADGAYARRMPGRRLAHRVAA